MRNLDFEHLQHFSNRNSADMHQTRTIQRRSIGWRRGNEDSVGENSKLNRQDRESKGSRCGAVEPESSVRIVEQRHQGVQTSVKLLRRELRSFGIQTVCGSLEIGCGCGEERVGMDCSELACDVLQVRAKLFGSRGGERRAATNDRQ